MLNLPNPAMHSDHWPQAKPITAQAEGACFLRAVGLGKVKHPTQAPQVRQVTFKEKRHHSELDVR